MKTLLALILSSASAMAVAADPTTLVIPKITKPLVEAVENDPLQADYDKMWTDYEDAVQKATNTVKEALGKQIAKATDGGELDLVEMWEGKQKRFAETGVLDWDTGSKASVEWKKANPKVPYPREFNEAVRSAASSFASAKEKLEEGYADLVKAYTKAKNVPRAKDLRDEGAALSKTTIASLGKPAAVEKRESSPISQRGAVKFKGHSYKVFMENTPWHEAKKKCEEMGGHLVMITDATEEAFIHQLVSDPTLPFGKADGKSDGLWLGATDERQEGHWLWVNGDPVAYANWVPNQPNNKKNSEHYAMLYLAEMKWVDQPASSTQHDTYFICEWEE